MAKLQKLCFNNVTAIIYSNDHCDPHVHFECDQDDWEFKLYFSFETQQSQPLRFEKTNVQRKGRPNKSQMLAASLALLNNIEDCKQLWWKNVGNICVRNKMGVFSANNDFSLVKYQTATSQIIEQGRLCPAGHTMIKPYHTYERKVL